MQLSVPKQPQELLALFELFEQCEHATEKDSFRYGISAILCRGKPLGACLAGLVGALQGSSGRFILMQFNKEKAEKKPTPSCRHNRLYSVLVWLPLCPLAMHLPVNRDHFLLSADSRTFACRAAGDQFYDLFQNIVRGKAVYHLRFNAVQWYRPFLFPRKIPVKVPWFARSCYPNNAFFYCSVYRA